VATGPADPAFPPPVAGTVLSLLTQLRTAGWAAAEVEAVGQGYRLAHELVSGQERANGLPLIDHFVATASVVATAGERPALVRAALAHNAYQLGRWRNGRPGATARRRREVRAALGDEAEALVLAYGRFAWWEDDIDRLWSRSGALSERERDLVLLRLANEVADRSDLGLLLSHQHRRPLEPMIDLAGAIDQPVLARWLGHLGEQEASATVEPGLRRLGNGVEVLAPRSHRRRVAPALYDRYRALRRTAGRARRAWRARRR